MEEYILVSVAVLFGIFWGFKNFGAKPREIKLALLVTAGILILFGASQLTLTLPAIPLQHLDSGVFLLDGLTVFSLFVVILTWGPRLITAVRYKWFYTRKVLDAGGESRLWRRARWASFWVFLLFLSFQIAARL